MTNLTQLVNTYISNTELKFQTINSGLNNTPLSQYRLATVDIRLGDTMLITGDAKGDIELEIRRRRSSDLTIDLSYDVNEQNYQKNKILNGTEYSIILNGIDLNSHDTILSLSFHQLHKKGETFDHDGTIHPLP